MKKFIALILAIVTLSVCAFALVGCNNDEDSYVANRIIGAADEQYGYCVGKTASKKTEILNAMNKVIEETDIDKAVTYYTDVDAGKTPSVTIEMPDLSDNTAGTLNVYTNAAFAPYEFVKGGQIVGVDVYLMSLVCEELNMKINVVDMDFNGIVGKVATEDNAVGAAGITITSERMDEVAFSNPYYSSVQYIVSAESKAYDEIIDLKGKKIGVQKGTTGYLLIDKEIKEGALKDSGAEIIEYANAPLAFAAMKSGRCDAVVIDELPAKKLVR